MARGALCVELGALCTRLITVVAVHAYARPQLA
jgi:hypothetical protein